MLVMDFAGYATEVKSAHFGKGQWTLHPIVAFFNDPSLECLRQHVIMVFPDDTAHDYHAVQKFTEVALKNFISPIKELIMWSDGCATQYKGKGSFADLSLSSAFSPKVQRCYFSSEHGKGEADGATGILSQVMSRAVSEGCVFCNAKDMFNWASQIWRKQLDPAPQHSILLITMTSPETDPEQMWQFYLEPDLFIK
ncbi:hypothetical protein RRG08_011664 [Elysia crispata]|uniref:Uncharacterized protein n=1 Tax=Elysia crispata TaxID=231223 RepID=A0AAE0YKB7_9GAST|nr:hypothetical protein RRG08_011664 [Elysia crispata]